MTWYSGKLRSFTEQLNFDILFFQATNFSYTLGLYVVLPFLLRNTHIKPLLASLFTGEAFAALAILPFMVSPGQLTSLIDRLGRGAYIRISAFKILAALVISLAQIFSNNRLDFPQILMIIMINIGNAMIPHWELTRKGYSFYTSILGSIRLLSIISFLAFKLPWILLLGHGFAFFASGLFAMLRHLPTNRPNLKFSIRELYKEIGPHAYLNGVRAVSLALAINFLPRTVSSGMVFTIASIERLGRPIVTLSTPHFLRLQTRMHDHKHPKGQHWPMFLAAVACFMLTFLHGVPLVMPIAWGAGILLDFWIVLKYLPLRSPLPENYNPAAFWMPILILSIGIFICKTPSTFWPLLFSCVLIASLRLAMSNRSINGSLNNA